MMKRTNTDMLSGDSSASAMMMMSANGSSEPATKKRKQQIPAKSIILRSGRLRLTDKLMAYLNAEVAPGVLYWQEEGTSFSFDTKRAQTELLDRYFKGMKLSSFTRSLNRWGFKRTFNALEPKSSISYEHPLFLRDAPELVADMTMVSHDNNITASVSDDQSNKVATVTKKAKANQESRQDDEEKSVATTAASSVPSNRAFVTTSMASAAAAAAEYNSEAMISQLRKMGAQLQNLYEEQQKKRQEQEMAAQRNRQQMALQAIIANSQSNVMRNNLELKHMGLQGLIQSSLASDPAKRTNAFSNNMTAASLAPRQNPTRLAQELLIKLLSSSALQNQQQQTRQI